MASFFVPRIDCHFCGARSPYKKNSGIPDFQCSTCEAVNYLDSKGDITDTPITVAAQSHRQPQLVQSFTEELPETLSHQQNQAFCNTCLHNQRILMETLSNYLPDEDHPQYRKFEAALPQFKEDLERRYPQICKRCAPKAQNVIHKADYYAGTQNVAALGRKTNPGRDRGARRQRDDWGKWCMRKLLSVVGLVYYTCLLGQIAWHAYGIMATPTIAPEVEGVIEDTIFDASPKECIRQSIGSSFNPACYQLFSMYMGKALLVTGGLIWYNPGLRYWFHHTSRMEIVNGGKEYFWLQVIMLGARAQAYTKMSDTAFTAGLTKQQAMAIHGFMIVFMLLVQFVANSVILPVPFKLKMKMMPSAEQRDVLGSYAGPEHVSGVAQASSIRPSELFARDRNAPFPIQNLAPKSHTNRKAGMPSPPPSDETDEDDADPDAMDVDWSQQTSASRLRPRTSPSRPAQGVRSMYNHGSTQGLGWSGMRDELFGIQDNMQLQNERKRREEEAKKLHYQPPVEQSPFRGRLPQAPMSLERKLRNPPTQFSFKQTPASKQQNFMQQMRSGIEQGKAFARQQEAERQQQAFQRPSMYCDGDTEDDEEFSPAKTRTRGELQLRQSQWQFTGDQPKDTGLEDLFGGRSFTIAEEPAVVAPTTQTTRENKGRIGWMIGFGVLGAVLAVAWASKPLRRAVCLWLVNRLENMGY